MKKINLTITGCMGRMGQQIIKSVKLDRDFKLVALTESKIINKKIDGIKIGVNNKEAFKNANIIIDFTVPKCTLQVLTIASKQKKKSNHRHNRIFKKRGKINSKVFKKNTHLESWKYEFGY